MKLLRPSRVVWTLFTLLLLLLCYLFAHIIRSSHSDPHAAFTDTLRVRRAFMSKLLESNHVFVPASSEAFKVWIEYVLG